MKNKTVHSKRQSKAKAGLAAAAGIAVLLGGSSTFARWAQEIDDEVTGTISDTITNGDWELGLEGAIDMYSTWFDTHMNVRAHVALNQDYQLVANAFRNLEGPGDSRVYGDSLQTWALANTDLEASETVPVAYNGQEVAIGLVALVPGDTLLGIYEVDPESADPDIKLNADHLRVYVDGEVVIGDFDYDFSFESGNTGNGYCTNYMSSGDDEPSTQNECETDPFNGTWVSTPSHDAITADAYDNSNTDFHWLTDHQIAVVVGYAGNWTEDLVKSKTDYAADRRQVSSTSLAVVTDLKVTLVQHIECLPGQTWDNSTKTCATPTP